jgi:hypothetical protein
MDTKQAIDIINAVRTLETATGMSFQQVVSRVIFYDAPVLAVMDQAINLYNTFIAAPLVERGAMMGITIHEMTAEESAKCVEDWIKEDNEEDNEEESEATDGSLGHV